ncbi:hypothetical protein B7R22_09850 [Subtercola boreus]|uniref:Phage capsid-like C-terminal domain-containing protein n=1 Tax=Subtercola boreus TaxID=120213 RepID=A0A3E0VWR6_9MICO|nr:phage major capsid protein [Subtercola boreus]RFA14514.1 hypothetical protein B7R22_09850 [Subtercola boreus]
MSAIQKNIARLLEERAAAWEKVGKPLADIAATRELTPAEKSSWEGVEADNRAFEQRLETLRGHLSQEAQIAEFSRSLHQSEPFGASSAGQWLNRDTGVRAALEPKQAFITHPNARAEKGDDIAQAMFSGIGQMVRALTTTGGSAIVPASWSATLIDLARSKAAITQAGATIIPMDTQTVNIGRATGDASAAFRAEGGSIATSDPTFDNVTLTAKTMSALVKGSLEFFQDADNADEVVSNAIARAIAGKLDQVALYGGITAGAGAISLPTPPNPRGILAALNAQRPANVLGTAAANGTVQTVGRYYDELIDLLYTVRDSNETPTGLVWNSKVSRMYSKAYDTTGQPLNIPSAVSDVPRFESNNLPSYTLGTMASRANDVFAGDFSQLIIGQRLGVTLQLLTERYADTGEIGIVAHWRGDVQPARPSAFAVYRGLQGAL